MQPNNPNLPPTITITAAPWAGTYQVQGPSADGLYSWWGPEPTGTVRWMQSPAFIKPSFELPQLHITVAPDDVAGSVHVSLDMSGGRRTKFAHLYNWGWDTKALNTQNSEQLSATDETHPGALNQAWQEAYGQIVSHRGMQDYDFQRAKYVDSPAEVDLPRANGVPQPTVVPQLNAYIDEVNGDSYSFAVSDGRSLFITRHELEEAAQGLVQLPYSDCWLMVKWGDREVPLPDTLFHDTTSY